MGVSYSTPLCHKTPGRISFRVVFCIGSYAIALVLFFADRYFLETPVSVLLIAFLMWLSLVIGALKSGSTRSEIAWALGSIVFMYRPIEKIIVFLTWSVQGFAP